MSVKQPPILNVHSEGNTGAPTHNNSPALTHILLLLLFTVLLIALNPRSYLGGGWDDGRYLAAAARWAAEGPVLGGNHWALRWPLVLPAAAIISAFGMNGIAVMVPGLLFWLGLVLFNYWAVSAAAGRRAGFIAAAAIATTPGLAYWVTALYPDHLEALLWSVALWSLWFAAHARPGAAQMRWMIAGGLATGLSIGLRETAAALLLVTCIAAWRARAIPRHAWLVWMLLAALPPVVEHISLWLASGDPAYRLRVDLNHIHIPSHDLQGGVASNVSAPLNATLMERWAGAGPVRLHWLIDPYINLFINLSYGLNFAAAAILGLVMRRRRAERQPISPLLRWMVLLIAANLLVNIYLLALNPSPRMFVPATVAAAIMTGILADRLWSKGIARLLATAFAVKILATLIVVDVAPAFNRIVAAAERVAAAGPLHVDWVANAHLALAPRALRSRFDFRAAPAGGHMLMVVTDHEQPLPPGRWRLVAASPVDHDPWTVRILAPVVHAAGFMRDFRYPDVEARLYRRLPDVAANGHPAR
jgi:4-amino-4-deoxy-L-arabinose transferase-like glycosyltransferase